MQVGWLRVGVRRGASDGVRCRAAIVIEPRRCASIRCSSRWGLDMQQIQVRVEVIRGEQD